MSGHASAQQFGGQFTSGIFDPAGLNTPVGSSAQAFFQDPNSGNFNTLAGFGQPQAQSRSLVNPGSGNGGSDLTGVDKFFGNKGGFNLENISSSLGAFSSLAEMFLGFKALGAQKKQFNFQKDAFNANFGANIKAFNNALRDKFAANQNTARSRGNEFESLESFLGPRQIDPQTIG